MTNTTVLLEDAKNAVGHVPLNHQAAWVNLQSLRQLVTEKESAFRFQLLTHPAATPLVIGNSIVHAFSSARNGDEFLSLKSALEYCEQLPEVIAASKIMDPLVAEVRRLEAQILDEQRQYGEKIQAIREAEEAAIAKAQAAVEKDPALQKLREQAEVVRPAHIEPPPLFRGKVNLEAVA